MVPATDTKNGLAAWLMAVGGLLLVCAAPSLPHWLPLQNSPLLYTLNLLVWIIAIGGMIALAMQSSAGSRTIIKYALVLDIFAICTCPLNYESSKNFSAATLSLAGGALLLAGFIHLPNTHPYFARLNRLLRRTEDIPSWFFSWALFWIFVAVAVSLSWYCFRFFPTIIDSMSQYLHGKFIATGHLYGESHPLHYFFNSGMMINHDGKWYSQYQPMHVFLLGIGHFFGTPWLVNPLDGAITLVAIYVLARRICDEPTAKLAALLTLCCPLVVFMSSEYMSHATALMFTSVFLLMYVVALEALPAATKTKSHAYALASGLCLGSVFLSRPLTAVNIGMPFILYSLYLLWRNPRGYFTFFAAMGAGAALCVVFQGWYNVQTTGDMLVFPYAKYNANNIPGFNGTNSFLHALSKARSEWQTMNGMLFELGVPSMIFIVFACLLPLENRYLRLLAWVIVSATLVNMANRFSSKLFGPRYIYETAPALIILTAVGIRKIPELLASWQVRLPSREVMGGMVAFLVMSLFAAGWAENIPPRFALYSHNYINGNPKFYYAMMRQAKAPALVFIEQVHQPKTYNIQKYLHVAHSNPPRDDAPVIFAIDWDKKNRKLMEYYPNRNAYLERDGILYPIDKTTFTSDAPSRPKP